MYYNSHIFIISSLIPVLPLVILKINYFINNLLLIIFLQISFILNHHLNFLFTYLIFL